MKQLVFLFFSLFLLNSSFSQTAYNNNWHFGSGVGMNVSGSAPVISASAIAVGSGVTPASISNAAGQFQCSSNGLVVRNFNGDVIDNGQFNSLALENIFMPVPDNPGKYYLFRSGAFGVDYSIVDMNLNGGTGGIAEDEKEIVFHNKLSQLMITQHSNLEDFWLLTADNNNGDGDDITVRSWLVNGSSVTQQQVFTVSYIFAGWFNELDDARIAPTCDKIAMMHKGHYMSLYQFSNETGVVSNPLPSAIDTQTSFTQRCNLEFSPNGQYLYVIGDFYKIDRFNLETWTAAAIITSKVVIAQQQQFQQTWQDIKLSPNGEIYLYNSNASVIDKIINPNVDQPEFGVESTGVSVTSSTYFFPNTPYLTCGVINSQPAISVSKTCLGFPSIVSFDFATEVDEFYWDFGDPNATFESTTLNPSWVIYSAAGTYEITLNLFFGGQWQTYTHFVVISEQPVISLGEDQQICEGETVTFGVPNQGYAYLWNTGQTTSEIVVAEAGSYGLIVSNQGCTFSDEVVLEVTPQIIVVLEDVAICGEGSTVLLDATNTAADTYLWNTGAQTPSIEVQTTGTYSVTLSNSCFTVSESAQVEFVVFPDAILPDDITACQNQQVTINALYTSGSLSWSTGANTSQIVVNQPGTYTLNINHLGCLAQDEIVVSFIPEVAVNLQDYVFCDNEPLTLNAFHQSATNYLWSTGATTPQITVSTGGSYWVAVSNSCFTAVDSSNVQYINFPSPLIPATASACEGDVVEISTNYTLGNITWSNGISGPSISITETGVYSVLINHLGCEAEAQVSVDFEEFVSLDDLEMPNVFTPNGDLQNEEFRPFVVSNPQLVPCNLATFKSELIIYNRWGKEISKGDCVWDGNGLAGQSMHDGTYYYIINLESNCYQRNETRQIVGHVSLLR